MTATDEQIIEWATRHDIERGVSTLSDLRCAFEDAQTLTQPPCQGWKLIPIEPTDAMLDAGRAAGAGPGWLQAYEAMIKAAPKQ